MSRRTEPGEDRRKQEGRSRRLSMPPMEADAARGDPRRAECRLILLEPLILGLDDFPALLAHWGACPSHGMPVS